MLAMFRKYFALAAVGAALLAPWALANAYGKQVRRPPNPPGLHELTTWCSGRFGFGLAPRMRPCARRCSSTCTERRRRIKSEHGRGDPQSRAVQTVRITGAGRGLRALANQRKIKRLAARPGGDIAHFGHKAHC